MKFRKILTALAGVGMVLAVAPQQAGAAKASVKVYMTGDCADGKMVENTDEDDCQITVNVSPKSKNVTAILEVSYDEQDPEWEELDSGRTRGGRLIFDLPSTDEDDVWFDGVILYHVIVKKSAGVTVPKVRDYKVEYVSGDNATEEDTQMSEEDKAFNEEMDKAKADNQQKIQQQQPNAPIYQGGSKGQDTGPMNQQQMQQQGSQQNKGGFDKAGEFNRACGSIQFPADKCQQLVQVKSPKEALAILGDQAEKWCNALVNSKERTVSCNEVLPKAFPPING